MALIFIFKCLYFAYISNQCFVSLCESTRIYFPLVCFFFFYLITSRFEYLKIFK
uniref:Uncharacterized protein n=1 Tax=Heterorhabditis bacteriophora TaxID=37862 RepID=A0A1I7X008_HETBA